MCNAAGGDGWRQRRRSAGRGMAKGVKARLALAAAASLAVASIYASDAEAKGIRGAKVTAGSASIRQKGPHTTIRAADRTIIRYDRFNVRKGESVRFVQPSKDARVLNRISGASPTRINGKLSANGSVYFVNPAGVIFGRGSVLNVGALYAAAGDMHDEDFLNGVNRFQVGPGRVENQGMIVAGGVHLAGGEVVNTGTIVTDGGIVTMTSGSDVFLAEEEGSILVRVEPAAKPGGSVRNGGEIRAGSVQMVGGSGVGDIFSIAVRNSGRVKARQITIDAKDGMAQVGGTLDASSETPGQPGGNVKILGDKVALTSARVDASGPAGGGTVLIGGDFQGKGETPNASRTFVSAGSTVAADATARGDGGRVIVWSDEVTGFAGQISAKGAAAGGDGGFVEVSGKEKLAFRGAVDVSAPTGAMGTVLLDPRDITIVDGNGGADDAELSEILFGDNDPPDAADETDFTISETDLEAINGTIILQAQQDVIIADLTTDGNLNLANVNLSTESLVIQAGRHITFLDTTNTITTAGGNVHLEADSPHSTTLSPAGEGILTLGNIVTGGGSVTLIGDNFSIANPINTGAGNITAGRSVDGVALRIGTATSPHLDTAEIAKLQTNGVLTLGQVTTAGNNGAGGSAQQLTAGAVTIDGASFGSRNLAIAGGTIDDLDDAGNAIATTGSLTLIAAGAIGGQNGAEGLNTNIDSLTVTSTGGNDVTITNSGIDSLELASVATGGAGNIRITQRANNLTIQDGGVITTGSVALEVTAGSINAAGGSENNAVEEITGTGGVTLSGAGIGNTLRLEIAGDNALAINSSGTDAVDIDVIATPFDSIAITQSDRRADILIALPGTDLIDINGTTTSLTEGTTNDVVLAEVNTGGGVHFDYTLSDVAGNVLIKMGNVFARGDFTVSSAGDITLGDLAGVVIQANAGRDVALSAGGAITNNGGVIAMNAGDLTLSAGTAIGSTITPIATTGSYNLQADAALGGVFLTNGTAGDVTVTGAGVSAVGADVGLRNTAGALNIAAGGVSTTGAGNITIEGTGVSHTGGTIAADTGTVLIDANDGSVTTGTITTNAAGNAVRVIDTGTLAVNGPMSAANGTVVLGEGGAGDRIGGNITQNASGVIAADTLTIDSASGNIDLNGVLNAIATLGAVSRNGRLRLTDDGGLTISSALTATTISNELSISTDNGALLVNADVFTSGPNNIALAGEGITLAPGITINAGDGTISLDGNGGAIDLGAGTLTTANATASAITARDATAVTLGTTTAAAGGLVLGVGQDITGAVSQSPLTGINVNSVSASTAGAITLDSTANAINELGAVTRGGALTIRDAGGGLTIAGPVTGGMISNPVDIATAGGVLAIDGDISTSGANNVSLLGVGVTQSAGTTIDGGAGEVLIDAAGGAIDLATGTITTTDAAAASVTLRNASTVALGNLTAPNGTLVVGVAQDVIGNVTQNPTTTIDAGTVTASTAGTIALDAVTNTIGSLGPITRGGALTVRDSAGGLTIGAAITGGTVTNAVDIATAGAALAINADVTGSDITLTGPGLTQSVGSTITASTGTALLDGNAGVIDLAGTVFGGTAITVRDGAATQVGTLTSPGGTITLGVGNNITGALTQSGPITSSGLTISTAGTVTLTDPSNDVLTLSAESDGDFAYTDANDVAALGVDSTNGDIRLTALTGTLTVLTLNAGAGDIELTADDMNFIGAANTITGTGDLTLRPVSVARDITLGAGAVGGLALTDVELAALQDGFNLITIGRVADGTGTLSVTDATFTDDVSLVGGSIVLGLLDAGTNDATLTARIASISDSSGLAGANVIAQTVTLNAITGIGASGAAARVGLETPTVTATNTTSGGIFLDGVRIGGIDFNAIEAQTAGNIELTSIAGATLTAVNAVGGSATADATGLLNAVNVTAGVSANLHGGTVTIDTVTAQNNAIVSSDGSITATSVTAVTGNATLSAGTSIDVALVSANGTASLTTTNGNIAGTAGDAAADIVAPIINLTVVNAGTVGTSSADLEVNATTLSASTNNGDIFLIDTDGGVVAGLIDAGSADVSLTSANGPLASATVDGVADILGDIITLVTTGPGNPIGTGSAAPLELSAVTLNASTTDADIVLLDTAGGLTVGSMDAGTADIDLTVTGGNLTSAAVDGFADVIGSHVQLTLSSAGNSIGIDETNGLEIAADTLEAGTNNGDIFILEQDGGLAITLVDAGLGDVTLIAADAGSITSATVDGIADVIGDHVTIRTQVDGSIGVDDANPLEVNAATLSASATSAGGSSQIFLLDTTGGVAVGSIAADEVELTAAGGGISSATVDGAADVVTTDITLRVSGIGSDIGATTGSPLEIDAGTLTAATDGGAGDHIFILDTAGGVAIDSVSAGAGNFNLTATNGSITSAAAGAGADILGNAVNLRVIGAGEIGASAADSLPIDASVLSADTSDGGGDIFITDVQGGVAVGLVTAGIGDVVLRAEDGSITSQTVDGAADIVGSNVDLAVTGNARTIGTSAASRVELDATVLRASTSSGGIFITDRAGGVTVGTLDAGAQEVNLSATGGSIADDGDDATTIAAGSLFLDVGATHGIGAAGGTAAIDTDVDALTASTGTGGLFVQEANGLTLDTINSMGQVRVTALAGDIVVNAVSAADQQVRLTAAAGAIADGNGAATNVSGGDLRFTADDDISLDTAGSILTASSNTGNVDLREADGATLRSIAADNGDVTVATATGDLAVQDVTAGGTADLTATAGSILDDGNDATEIAADEILLTSGSAGAIGGAGTLPDMDTRGGIITATGGAGGAFISEADGARLTAAVTADGIMRIRNAGGGTLVIAGATSSDTGNISIDSEGPIRISAPLTSDAGSIALDSNGVTEVRSGSVSSDSGDVTFGANRTGQVSLRGDVSADEGTVTFNRRVNVDGDAQVSAGRAIDFAAAINGAFALRLDGDADTDVTLAEAVGGNRPLSGLTINGRDIAVQDVTVDGDIIINSVPQIIAGLPEGLITLGGDVRSVGGHVRLNAGGRGDVPTVATIAAGGDVTVSATGDVEMGRNEKFTALGDLTIEAGGTARLGDLTALNTLTINSDSITLLLRDPGGVRAPSGAVEQDAGLDIIGGDGIELGSKPITDGTGAAPRFASNDGVGLDRVNLAGLQTFALTTPVTGPALQDGLITLDGRVDGVIVAIVPVVAPKEARQAQFELGVGAGMMADLEELGVFVKDLQLEQLIQFLERMVVYDDVPPEMAAVPRDLVEPNRYRITRNRISFRAAAQVVEAYYGVFFTTTAGEDGQPKRELKLADMDQKIDGAIADYRTSTGATEIDPLALRRFVEETPSHAEALAYMNGIRDLFMKIQPIGASESGGGGLGLTPAEAAVSRQVILSRLKVRGATRQELETAILGVPAPVVDEQAR